MKKLRNFKIKKFKQFKNNNNNNNKHFNKRFSNILCFIEKINFILIIINNITKLLNELIFIIAQVLYQSNKTQM